MLESAYQAGLIKKMKLMYPDCIIMKMDSQQQQGWPDLLILFNTRWATLEVKASRDAKRQPNQEYWVEYYSRLTFSSFIYPENENEVLERLTNFFLA